MRRKRLVTLLGVIVGATLLPSCRHVRKTPEQRGEGIFVRSCATCHGLDARGTHPPGFTTPPRDLTDPALQARLDDRLLRETIRYGKGQMPPFRAALVPEDLDDLVRYLRTLRRER